MTSSVGRLLKDADECHGRDWGSRVLRHSPAGGSNGKPWDSRGPLLDRKQFTLDHASDASQRDQDKHLHLLMNIELLASQSYGLIFNIP
jgi:hypothetical protein